MPKIIEKIIDKCRIYGRCCIEFVSPRFWETTKGLTVEQKNFLREERKKYPPNKEPRACEMHIKETINGQEVTSCLVQKLFNIKPAECSSHPADGHCKPCENYGNNI